MTANEELLDLVSEGYAALAAPAIERVHACLTVLPRIVEALDRVSRYQTELRDVRSDLTAAVRHLREEVWKAQKVNPEATYRAAHVHAALKKVTEVLDRLDRLIYAEE